MRILTKNFEIDLIIGKSPRRICYRQKRTLKYFIRTIPTKLTNDVRVIGIRLSGQSTVSNLIRNYRLIHFLNRAVPMFMQIKRMQCKCDNQSIWPSLVAIIVMQVENYQIWNLYFLDILGGSFSKFLCVVRYLSGYFIFQWQDRGNPILALNNRKKITKYHSLKLMLPIRWFIWVDIWRQHCLKGCQISTTVIAIKLSKKIMIVIWIFILLFLNTFSIIIEAFIPFKI